MKILIHGLNFAPELIGIGKYTGEMAAWLAAHGHDVRVVTAFPYYPQWRIAAGEGGRFYRRETWNGVQLYRCPLWVPRRPGGWRRILHLLSFAATSAPVTITEGVLFRPDVVMGVEPTLMAAPATLLAAWLGGGLSWLHVQDFEVDAAFGVNLLRGDRLRRWSAALEGRLLRTFGRVSSISARMCANLEQKHIARDRIRLLPNWVETGEIFPLPGPSPLRAELGIDDSAIVALYAGNMNEKQGLDMLLVAARALRTDPQVLFVFAGEGAARARLEVGAADLPNLRFLPLQPAERLNALLNLADIHLLPQRRGVADLVMPSKVLGMMASGRPIVAGAAPETELGAVVSDCGILVPPEDGMAMAEAVRALAYDQARRSLLGAEGRRQAASEWSKDAVLSRLERWLVDAAGAPAIGARALPRPGVTGK